MGAKTKKQHKVSTKPPGGSPGSQNVAAETRLKIGITFTISDKEVPSAEYLRTKLVTAVNSIKNTLNFEIDWKDPAFSFKNRDLFFEVKFHNEEVEFIDSESVDKQKERIIEMDTPLGNLLRDLERIRDLLNEQEISGVISVNVACESQSALPA